MKIISFQARNAPVIGYLHDDHDRLVAHKTRPALVILAGGGYNHLSPREGEPVALRFFAEGYQCFLLRYSLNEAAGSLRPLHEAGETLRLLRERAAEFRIDPERVAILGFSAGGHLAASLSALWDRPEAGLTEASRPDALILCYPVITMGAFAHAGSRELVCAGDEELTELLSIEKQVGKGMPPTFVWHCVGDEAVPVENTLLLAEALQRAGVDYECHLFAGGAHGISLCNWETESPNPSAAAWVGLCLTWLNERMNFEP